MPVQFRKENAMNYVPVDGAAVSMYFSLTNDKLSLVCISFSSPE
jgi:hypothetical protein